VIGVDISEVGVRRANARWPSLAGAVIDLAHYRWPPALDLIQLPLSANCGAIWTLEAAALIAETNRGCARGQITTRLPLNQRTVPGICQRGVLVYHEGCQRRSTRRAPRAW
jgi:hypothetical protein